MAGERSRDQEAHGATGPRRFVFAAAMDSSGGEHQLVTHQHDAAVDVGGMRFEFFRRAAAEIDHLRAESVPRRGDGADQRMTGCKAAVGQAQGRRLRPP